MMKKITMLLALSMLLLIGIANAANQNRTNENITTTVTIQNSAPTFDSTPEFDDSDTSDSGAYIDLTPNETSMVRCIAYVSDADGDSDVVSANATFYNVSNGADGAADYSFRYKNSSCTINTDYGSSTQLNITCTAYIYWYADNGTWECKVTVEDNGNNVVSATSNQPTLRELYALDIDSSSALDFGTLAIGQDTGTTDQTVTVYNIGNMAIDLILEPYGSSENDGYSMACTGGNLDDSDIKYSLSSGVDYDSKTELTSGAGTTVSNFDLDRQTSGTAPSSSRKVHFGFGIQSSETGRSGSCSGKLMFTALVNS